MSLRRSTCEEFRIFFRLTAALDGADTSRLPPLEVSLVAEEQVRAAVVATTERFGGPDVVVIEAARALAVTTDFSQG